MDRWVDFEPRAKKELDEWKQEDKKTVLRIFELIENIQETPFIGKGKLVYTA